MTGGPYLQGANRLRGRMSRKDELLKLAELFHSQAKLTLSRDAKQTLQKIGDHYKREAEQLRTKVLFERPSSAHNLRRHKSAA